jgi:carboxypeptidase family protein/TonB-dependent receptor-like protein
VKHGLRFFVSSLGVAFLVLAMLAPSHLSAQVISGDLVGVVFDKTGAVVPNASVDAVGADTGVHYPTQANEAGEYRLNNLPAGTYNVTASAPNFASTTVNGFRVDLNKTSTLQITLEIKGAVTSIEVSGQAAALDTTTAQITNTFDQRLTQDLPSTSSNGGSGVLNLSLLSAGVASGGGIGAGTGPAIGGQRPRNNNFTVEGVDNNDKSVTGPLVPIPNDAVAEFTLLQNQFSPEFGHSSGGQFNTIIKSGTNAYHGEAYLYSDNRNFDAVDVSLKNQGFTSNPRLDNNRMGGNVGGPVLKNKLFFFANLEYNPVGLATVLGSPVCAPTAAGYTALNGISGLSATNLAILEKYVPAASTPDTNDVCGPNGGPEVVKGVTIPEDVLNFSGPNYTNNWNVLASLDYDISTKDQLRGRYVYFRSVGIDTSANLPAFYLPEPSKFHLVTINEYHNFNPNLQNELRVGYNRFANVTSSGNFSFPGLDSFPNITLDSLNGLNVGPDPNAPQFTIQNTYQLSEALAWTHGQHSLKFGIEGRKLIAPESFTQRARGDYEYTDLQTYLEDLSPDSFGQRSVGASTYYGDQSAIYWYANDNWRIRPNLTFNLGVRYEYTTTPFGARSQALNSAASVPGLLDFSAPRAPKNDWGPRIGFAYSPGSSGRTSIRGGFSESYDVHYDNIGILSLPPQLSVTENVDPTAATPNFLGSGGLPPGAGGITNYNLSNPACVGFPTAVSCQQAYTSTYYPPNVKDPKSINWGLGVQHTFWNDYTAEVRYIGTRGIHLDVQNIINVQAIVTPSNFIPTYIGNAPSQAALDATPLDLGTLVGEENSNAVIVPAYNNAGFNGSLLTAFEPEGASTYHGLATQLTRRFSNGLQFIAAYTYSHLIDNSTADFHTTDITPRRAQDFQDLAADRANSALDHRHRFTLTLLYDEPFFKNSNAFLKNSLGNWEIAPIYTYQSGEWATAQDGVDANLNIDQAGDRPIFNPAGVGVTGSPVVPLCRSSVPATDSAGNPICTLANALNSAVPDTNNPAITYDVLDNVVGYSATKPTAKYVQAYFGALANVGRNTILMPPINDIDITALKRFTITERFKIEFAAQAFNLLNHPQFIAGSINDVVSAGVTGSPRSALEPQNGNFNNFGSVLPSNSRTLQLSLKIFF